MENPVVPNTEAPRLVLASASPRRRQLLAEYGYTALVVPANIEESTDESLSVRELVLLNAQLKSAALWAHHAHDIVLGTDTLVCLDGRALGKPPDLLAAAAMLASLAGRWHAVYSGVCLACPKRGVVSNFVEETRVRFHPLTAAGIDAYLRLIDPLDKAGGYAAQEHGEHIIAAHEGSWTNVLGLPMETLGPYSREISASRPARFHPKKVDTASRAGDNFSRLRFGHGDGNLPALPDPAA